jgi:hypothetical protein
MYWESEKILMRVSCSGSKVGLSDSSNTKLKRETIPIESIYLIITLTHKVMSFKVY